PTNLASSRQDRIAQPGQLRSAKTPAADRGIPWPHGSRRRAAPCSLQADAGNLQGDARAARLGTIKLKARKHWLEPCARRNATAGWRILLSANRCPLRRNMR